MQVSDAVIIHKARRFTEHIVKDKIVYKEERHYARIRRRGLFRLIFSSYGTYMIPDESYSWSSLFLTMLPKTVYERSDYGDEFYLVLSKRHKGKIVFAYNTEMFEFEE